MPTKLLDFSILLVGKDRKDFQSCFSANSGRSISMFLFGILPQSRNGMRSGPNMHMVTLTSLNFMDLFMLASRYIAEMENSSFSMVQISPHIMLIAEGRVDPVDLALKNRNWF
jgi:hypothetical protein